MRANLRNDLLKIDRRFAQTHFLVAMKTRNARGKSFREMIFHAATAHPIATRCLSELRETTILFDADYISNSVNRRVDQTAIT